MFSSKQTRIPAVNWGVLQPSRTCRWEESGEQVTLLVPRFGEGIIGRSLDRLFHPKPYRANLDAIGTFVWRHCDGERSVAEIAQAMRSEFGEKADPVEDRLVQFLQYLERGRFVSVSVSHQRRAD